MFKERIQDNIKFIEDLLNKYPVAEKPPHCLTSEVETFRFKPSEKKNVTVKVGDNKKKVYLFDLKTNKIASPKLTILREAMKTQTHLLQRFVNNVQNSKVVKSATAANAETNDTELINSEGDEGEKEDTVKEKVKSKLHMTSSEKRKQKEEEEFERGKKEHENLITRKKRLINLIQQQKKLLEASHVSLLINITFNRN